MATIYDVARDLGLSHTAVSAVLNGKKARVSAATRERIVEAAERLGYRKNRAAQQLATGKFNTVALCFQRPWEGQFQHPVVNQLVSGVGISASANGLYLLFAPSAQEDRFESTIEGLPMHGVDGAIVVGSLPAAAIPAIDRSAMPLVCVDSHPGFARASTVDQDNRAGMRMGVEHLIANGHRRMAYFGDEPAFQCIMDRLAGFYDAIRNSWLSLAEQTAHIVPLADIETAVRRLLEGHRRPTAIVSGEECLTLAILDAVAELGLRIPEDLSIVAYGDPEGEHPLSESISIVRNVPFEVGKVAADVLKKMIDGEIEAPVSVRIPPELVLRPCPVSH